MVATMPELPQNSCINREPRGGRGLQNILETWEKEVVAVAEYLLQSEDTQVQNALRLQEVLADAGRYSYLEQARHILARHEGDDELELGGAKVMQKLKHLLAEEREVSSLSPHCLQVGSTECWRILAW